MSLDSPGFRTVWPSRFFPCAPTARMSVVEISKYFSVEPVELVTVK
ncbi:MAG: hypothetical protein RBU26_10505 [Sphaerochaeta sp.]|nr:hypothetical protein [Sphaerochaeta sp.]MDX9825356.1 hypothetical protein [Sphaerochaeta sp.]